MKKNKLVNRILFIIFLTNIPAILSLLMFFKEGISWILGSLISAANFWWMSQQTYKQFGLLQAQAKAKSLKSFYIRYLALIVCALAVAYFVKPNLIIFGVSLLSAQIAIYLNAAYETIKKNKYFKG
ncbi:MAG: hypothetical protein PWQ09_370 [Candidatus Cloacimonadota bacterium]|jgi:hypothetical protein|nr:hypothetical protein [Candidatus Cloacimonadota bacterium]